MDLFSSLIPRFYLSHSHGCKIKSTSDLENEVTFSLVETSIVLEFKQGSDPTNVDRKHSNYVIIHYIDRSWDCLGASQPVQCVTDDMQCGYL